MAVKIERSDDGNYTVNGKFIHRDMNGNFSSEEELTYTEHRTFREYIKAQELDLKNRLN